MSANDAVLVGWSDKPETLLLNRANRHGVVAGATGTGKTVTLQILAQGFSDAGVPVFAADVKGDLSGVCMPGDRLERFAATAGVDHLEVDAVLLEDSGRVAELRDRGVPVGALADSELDETVGAGGEGRAVRECRGKGKAG